MKRILFLIGICIVSINVLFAENTQKFNTVKVNVPSKIRILEGEDYSVDIRNFDTNNPVEWIIEDNNVLDIKYKYSNSELPDLSNVVITITAPENINIKVGSNFTTKEVAVKKNENREN